MSWAAMDNLGRRKRRSLAFVVVLIFGCRARAGYVGLEARRRRRVHLRASGCVCSGSVLRVGTRHRDDTSDYGTACARWDAPDELPWCSVRADACKTTFESGSGHFWSHEPCNGKGRAFRTAPTPKPTPKPKMQYSKASKSYQKIRLRQQNSLSWVRGKVDVAHNCTALYGMSICSTALANVLEYLQFGQECQPSTTLIMGSAKAHIWNYGLGATLRDKLPPLRWKALEQRKGASFVVPTTPWLYNRSCTERGWECFFEPSSLCRAPDEHTLKLRHGMKRKPLQRPSARAFIDAQRAARETDLFLSHTLALTLSPLPELSHSIAELKRDIGWASPIIGVHMRHGDIWKEHTVLTTQAYADVVAQVYMKTRIPRVFLATDDAKATPEAFQDMVHAAARARGIELASNFTVVRQSTRDTGDELARTKQTGAQGHAAITDMMLLSQSDVLVCMYSSGFGRVASLLGVARHGLHRFAFVDCDQWGGRVPAAPAFNWISNYENLIPWHGPHCARRFIAPLPSRVNADLRFAPDDLLSVPIVKLSTSKLVFEQCNAKATGTFDDVARACCNMYLGSPETIIGRTWGKLPQQQRDLWGALLCDRYSDLMTRARAKKTNVDAV